MSGMYGGFDSTYEGAGMMEEATAMFKAHAYTLLIGVIVFIVLYYFAYGYMTKQGLATGTAGLSAGGSHSDAPFFKDASVDHGYAQMSAADVMGAADFNCNGRVMAPTDAWAWQYANIGGPSSSEYFNGGITGNDASKAMHGY